MADKHRPADLPRRDGHKPYQSAGGAIIRPMLPTDRQVVRDICCSTAYRNKGNELFLEDREVHADYWTKYFTDYHPEDSWVVEDDGKVIGYFFGCTDQDDFLRVMTRRIVPSCILRGVFRMLTGQYKNKATGKYLRHMILRGGKEAPDISSKIYKSHYHCNILHEGTGKQYYTEMGFLFLDRLTEKGVTTLQAGATEPKRGGFHFRTVSQMTPTTPIAYDEVPTTLYERVLGDKKPMVNRGWGFAVEDFYEFMYLMRSKYRM